MVSMNLRTWLNDQLRRHTKPTAIELAQQQAALDAKYRQGGLDERYALLAQLAKEQQAAQAIDRALTPDPDYHAGDRVRAWDRANKPNYRPIRLLPAARDESWLNSKVIPVPPPVYEIPEPKTEHPLSALHELLDGYAETEKLKAVKAPERNKR